MSKYEDEDGIDGPLARAEAKALREIEREQSCKRCGREYRMTTPEDRARYDAAIFEALVSWRRRGSDRSTELGDLLARGELSRLLARASVYAEFLVAADRGLCRDCSPLMVRSEPDMQEESDRSASLGQQRSDLAGPTPSPGGASDDAGVLSRAEVQR